VKVLVGLGNPGLKYEQTRHNAGFWLLERFAARASINLRKDAKFQALVGRHDTTGTWLVLPQGYMNASGKPVQMLAAFFKIPASEIVVAHDELDFPPGTIRLKQGGGDAGHNGLKDISARLGTHDYWRLRIGIGHPGARDLVTHYLLNSHPARDERATIDAAIDRVLDVMPLMMAGDFQTAMLKLHTQDKPKAEEAPSKKSPATDPADRK
jgi:PTH1 family peptidyl-tRNA hydrolase